MRRTFDEGKPELLDVPQPANPDLEASLQSLQVLNQYFGAYSLVRHFMRRWLERGRTYRLLDLATGFGDIPRMIVVWARKHGISVRIDAIDLQPATLEIARRASAGFPEIQYIRADARNYCEAITYDIVCCSLAVGRSSTEPITSSLDPGCPTPSRSRQKSGPICAITSRRPL